MNKFSDQGFRVTALIMFSAAILVLSFVSYQYVQKSRLNTFVLNHVKDSLEQIFTDPWKDAGESGTKNAVEWAIVDLLLKKYNAANGNVFIESIGNSKAKSPPGFVEGISHSLTLNLADSQVGANIITIQPKNLWSYSIAAFGLIISGMLVFVFYPAYKPLDRYKLAKIYGCIFDRKVSSKKPWGSWQLTHLGTGSGMVNIQPNGFTQANNDEAVNKCIDGIETAIGGVEIAFKEDLENFTAWPANRVELSKITKATREKMKNRPLLGGEKDVGKFTSYVRDIALNTVVINLATIDTYIDILEVEASDIEVLPPARWLTDGYQVFMPRIVWDNILRSLNAGVRMAYNKAISGIKVYTDEVMPFICIDFIVGDTVLDNANVSRLKEYIQRPFPGDLDDLVNAVSDYGKLLILDRETTIDLTERRSGKGISARSLTIRFLLRRIDIDERKQVAKLMDKALKDKSNWELTSGA